jgi:hypothetical protein
MVRRRWAERVERGAVEGGQADETPVLRTTEWAVIAVAAALIAASVVTLMT